jgi:TorA maturation chaperone TorD
MYFHARCHVLRTALARLLEAAFGREPTPAEIRNLLNNLERAELERRFRAAEEAIAAWREFAAWCDKHQYADRVYGTVAAELSSILFFELRDKDEAGARRQG